MLGQELEFHSLQPSDLATECGWSVGSVQEVLDGRAPLTETLADAVERLTGGPAYIWRGLQDDYDYATGLRLREDVSAEERGVLKRVPYRELAEGNHVPPTRSPKERVLALRHFLKVGRLEPAAFATAAVCRTGREKSPDSIALAAWLRCGEAEWEGAPVATFRPDAISKLIPDLRALTLAQEGMGPAIRDTLAKAGVAVSFAPHLKGTYAQGAVWTGAEGRVHLQLSVRGKWADVFWFSLFHEVAHLCLGHLKDKPMVTVEAGARRVADHMETEADEFAADALLPDWMPTRLRRPICGLNVRALATEYGVHPGIVVGRLHHEGLLPPSHLQDLRAQLAIPALGDAPTMQSVYRALARREFAAAGS
jgi:HTH-type transcriptional regulator/antitoxin HigA